MILSLENPFPVPTAMSTYVDTIYDSWLYDYLDHDMEDQYLQHSLNNCQINRILQGNCKHFLPNSLFIAKLTMAMELAITTEKAKPKISLPLEYADFAQVFFKEATDHVPPSRPYDHEINLDESFMPKIGKIYPLSPNEKKATKDFLKENLATGKIRPSNSPQVSPFFLSRRKTVNSTPAKFTGTSTNTPTVMPTPFPSSPTLWIS